jgi:hypothetical protein
MPPLPDSLSTGGLVTLVLVVIVAELAGVMLLWRLGSRRALMRQMLPGACAGFFLVLALRDLAFDGHWLPVWLASAGAAHALDWWQRSRLQAAGP